MSTLPKKGVTFLLARPSASPPVPWHYSAEHILKNSFFLRKISPPEAQTLFETGVASA